MLDDPHDHDFLTLDGPFWSPEPETVTQQKGPVQHVLRGKKWRVDGVFLDGNTYHGLAFNPHTKAWFHLWWNQDGKCQVFNCSDPCWDLLEA